MSVQRHRTKFGTIPTRKGRTCRFAASASRECSFDDVPRIASEIAQCNPFRSDKVTGKNDPKPDRFQLALDVLVTGKLCPIDLV